MVYTRSMKKRYTGAKARTQTLPDLPSDLMFLIMSRLSLKDNIRASAVCKTWHEACVSVRVEEPTPWVMFTPLDKEEYELYDPSLGETHISRFPELRGSQIRYSRDGWLLKHDITQTNSFFFNPFTHERIKVVPDDLWLNDAVAFSCAPTSSSCVLFSVFDTINTLVIIKTYHPTTKKQTTLVLPHHLPLDHGVFNQVVFSNGVFYCLTIKGCLGMFDPSKNSWSSLPRRPPKRLEASPCFMTEYQGDIFLVYTHGLQKQTYLKLDLKNRRWTETTRLSGLTFYLGFQSFVTTTRELVSNPKVDRWPEFNVWIKPPTNVSDLFKFRCNSYFLLSFLFSQNWVEELLYEF